MLYLRGGEDSDEWTTSTKVESRRTYSEDMSSASTRRASSPATRKTKNNASVKKYAQESEEEDDDGDGSRMDTGDDQHEELPSTSRKNVRAAPETKSSKAKVAKGVDNDLMGTLLQGMKVSCSTGCSHADPKSACSQQGYECGIAWTLLGWHACLFRYYVDTYTKTLKTKCRTSKAKLSLNRCRRICKISRQPSMQTHVAMMMKMKIKRQMTAIRGDHWRRVALVLSQCGAQGKGRWSRVSQATGMTRCKAM
jgi:hypothetical protein